MNAAAARMEVCAVDRQRPVTPVDDACRQLTAHAAICTCWPFDGFTKIRPSDVVWIFGGGTKSIIDE